MHTMAFGRWVLRRVLKKGLGGNLEQYSVSRFALRALLDILLSCLPFSSLWIHALSGHFHNANSFPGRKHSSSLL